MSEALNQCNDEKQIFIINLHFTMTFISFSTQPYGLVAVHLYISVAYLVILGNVSASPFTPISTKKKIIINKIKITMNGYTFRGSNLSIFIFASLLNGTYL